MPAVASAGAASSTTPGSAPSSGFDAPGDQAASLPAVMLTLSIAAAVYLISRRWWAGVGDAFQIVPVFYTLIVVGAAWSSALLTGRARIVGDQQARWMAAGIALAGLMALGQGTAIVRLASAPLHISGDGLAGLYLLWHATLVAFGLGAVFAPTARRLRRVAAGVLLIAVVVLATDRVPLGLVDDQDLFTARYDGLLLTLVVLTLATTGAWIVRCGRRPTRPQVWLAVCFALAAIDLTIAAGADRLYQSLWWSSAAVRAATFLVPAAGLTADALRLMARLHRHERSLHERLARERELAARTRDETAGAGPQSGAGPVRAVIEGGAFRTVFQGIHSLTSTELVALEALTRFTAEPLRSPDVWFAEAERCGLGAELELATVAAALRNARGLDPDLALSINVSPAVLVDPRFVEHLAADGDRPLIIEVTEHASVEDYEGLREALDRLRRERDVRVAIDDAGAGFSSLRHIVLLGPDLIKLDMSLVRDIHTDPLKQALAASLVDFGRSAGIELVAEGIETAEELATVRALGVHAAQGYLLGAPAPPEEALARGRPTAVDRPAAGSGRRS